MKMRAAALGLITMMVAAGACAPAPLYTQGGLHRGAATWGEIPRDARGEPVWAAIRPLPAHLAPQVAAASPRGPTAVQEGDADAPPLPPRD
jgi:hypothetical protein